MSPSVEVKMHFSGEAENEFNSKSCSNFSQHSGLLHDWLLVSAPGLVLVTH